MGTVVDDVIEAADDDIDDSEIYLRQFDEEDCLVVSYSVSIPLGQNPSLVYVGWARAEFLYQSEQYRIKSDDVVHGQVAWIENELKGERDCYESCYLVKMSSLLDVDAVSLSQNTQ